MTAEYSIFVESCERHKVTVTVPSSFLRRIYKLCEKIIYPPPPQMRYDMELSVGGLCVEG